MSRGSWVALSLAGALTGAGLAAAVAIPARDTPLSDAHSYAVPSRDHVLHPHWEVVPPVGGEHLPAWLACGVYDRPVNEGLAVHALEHGAVWVTYDPDLDKDDVIRLAEALPEEGILSPHDDLPGPVVVTVWGRQLVLHGARDSGLAAFIAEYGDGHTAPEPRASCAGGLVAYDGPAGVEV